MSEKVFIKDAAKRFGYSPKQVKLRLYVGKFKPGDEAMIRKHLGMIRTGAGPVKVIGLLEVLEKVRPLSDSKTYYDDPVICNFEGTQSCGMAIYSSRVTSLLRAAPRYGPL